MKVIYRSLIKVISYSAYICLFSLFLLILFELLQPTQAWAWSCPDGMGACVCYREGGYWGKCCDLGQACSCSSEGRPSCSGCFTGETEIGIGQESERAGEQEEARQISKLEEGDVVSSFNPETGEVSEGEVSEVSKLTREGYFELETESGKKVKVTAEHPFLAYSENNQSPVTSHQSLSTKLKNILSNTLTYQLIIGFQTKIAGDDGLK